MASNVYNIHVNIYHGKRHIGNKPYSHDRMARPQKEHILS